MAISWSFGDTIQYFQQVGVYDYFLPFLLIFAIIFAALEKVKIFGDNKENIHLVIAGVIGLVLIVQQPIVQTINRFLPRVSLIFVVILMGLLIITMMAGQEYQGLTGGVFSIMAVVVVIFIMLALSPTMGWETAMGLGFITDYFTYYDTRNIISIGFLILATFLAIKFIFGSSKKEGETGKKGDGLLKILEKGLRGKE